MHCTKDTVTIQMRVRGQETKEKKKRNIAGETENILLTNNWTQFGFQVYISIWRTSLSSIELKMMRSKY